MFLCFAVVAGSLAAIMHFMIVVVAAVVLMYDDAYKHWSFRCPFYVFLRCFAFSAQPHCTAYSPNPTSPRLSFRPTPPHHAIFALIWQSALSLSLAQLPLRPAAAAIKLILFCVCLSACLLVRHCSPFDLRCKFLCVCVFVFSCLPLSAAVSNILVVVVAARRRALILFSVRRRRQRQRRRRHFESEKSCRQKENDLKTFSS